MMQLLSYIALQFDGREVPYKLYYNPSDRKYLFKPEAVITLYSSFVAWRLEGGWGFEAGTDLSVQPQLAARLEAVLAQKEEPLL